MIKKLRWPLLVAIIALAAIAVILVGQQPTLTPINEPVLEPASGGVFVEALIGQMIRLNPVLDYYNGPDRDVDRLLFSGLVRFDDRGMPQGDLADSWGISRDGTVYNFSLRSNATWHDGKPVTSDDVIFTINLLKDDGAPIPDDLKTLWKSIEVKRLDEKTLQFALPEPYAPFLDYLTFGVLPEHALSGLSLQGVIDAPFNLHPIGSGPYRFDQLIVDGNQITGVALKTFEEYYTKPPFIEQVTFRYYPDAAAAFQAYKNGDILSLSSVPMEILSQVLTEPDLNLHTGRLPQLTMIFLNQGQPEQPFMKDAAIRKVLMMGLDRQRMIDRIMSGQAILADGPIFPGTWAYFEGIKRVEYDPDAAIEMLKKADYTIPAEGGSVRTNKDGVTMAFEMIYQDDATHKALAEAIQKDWNRLGIGVTLKPLSFADLMSALDSRLYQAALVDINLARSPDPDPYPFWHQAQITGGQNYSQWDDRQASEYLEQARVTVDITERTRLYRNFQVRFAQELPSLPLFYPVYRYAVKADVQGVSMGPLFDLSDRFTSLPSWFLVTRRASGEEPTPTP
jgi:peptide/nickel transport system substrate-binding protein